MWKKKDILKNRTNVRIRLKDSLHLDAFRKGVKMRIVFNESKNSIIYRQAVKLRQNEFTILALRSEVERLEKEIRILSQRLY